MSPRVYIETERLRLRDWGEADAAPFAAINRDPRVMEFFTRPLGRAESDAFLARNHAHIAEHGWGLFAVEEKATGTFIGFVGLAVPGFEAHFTPAVEIGWRLAREAWGQGYASEAARAVIDHAFGTQPFDGLVSFTARWNMPSQRVMQKIGMTRDPAEDFAHPKLPPEHKLSHHVLYRLSRADWQKAKGAAEAAP